MNKRSFVLKILMLFILCSIIAVVLFKYDVISFQNNNLPEAISLNQIEIGIKKNDHYQLASYIYPLNSYKGTIEWSSNDNEVVEVNEVTGYIYGKNVGDAIVTAKIPYNNLSIDCLVHVSKEDIPVNDINFTTDSVFLNSDATYQVKYQLYPVNANYRSIRFLSTDESVVKVDNKGLITALKNGEAYVKAIVGDKEEEIKVTVSDINSLGNNNRLLPTDLILSVNNVSLVLNGSIKIKSEVLPKGSNDNITYETLNSNVATVNDGEIKAVGYGKTQIIARTINDIVEVINVTVKEEIINISKIATDKKDITLYVGEKYDIPVRVYPSNATDQTLHYFADNEIIKVNSKGIVEALKVGHSKVIIKSKNNISHEVNVNVIENTSNIPITNINVLDNNLKLVKGNTKLLTYNVEPINADISSIKFSSSDNNIVKVSNTGLVTAVSEGKANIYLSYGNEVIKVDVEVIEERLVSLTTSTSYLVLDKGDTHGLAIGFVPNNASNVNLKWVSENPNIIKVENGVVKAIGKGKTIVSAISNDVKLDIIVEVREN